VFTVRLYPPRPTAYVSIFRGRNTRSARRNPRELWRNVQRKLMLLDAAPRLEDLGGAGGQQARTAEGRSGWTPQPPSKRSVRITFRWENGNAYEVRVEDYH
jgi:proteic killer suppression protein